MMPDEPQPEYQAGDKLLIEAEVLKVNPDGSMIVRMANGTYNIFQPTQVSKKP